MIEENERLPPRPKKLPHDAVPDLFRFARVAVHVPVTDAAETRRCLVYLTDEAHKLTSAMDRLGDDKHAQALLAQTTMQRWNVMFKQGLVPGRK